MASSMNRDKVKTNPYATIKMWRPVAMGASSRGDDPHGEVYTNFDALRSSLTADSQRLDETKKRGRLPVTGHGVKNTPTPDDFTVAHNPRNNPIRNLNDSPFITTAKPAAIFTDQSNNQKTNISQQIPMSNGYQEIPADYSREPSPSPSPGLTQTPSSPTQRKNVSFKEDTLHKMPNGRAVNTPHSPRNSTQFNSPPPPPSLSFQNPPPPPPPPPTIPPSLPLSSNNKEPAMSKRNITASNTTKHQQEQQFSSNHEPRTSILSSKNPTSNTKTSFQVVGDDATTTFNLVLSHSYTSLEPATRDIERLLAELKFTMDSVVTSRLEPSPAQLSMCQAELRSQTLQFIQDAKVVVSSANNSREKLLHQLQAAVHTLAKLFLHGQAVMLILGSPHKAQHLGLQLIKAANAFKGTVSAASAAAGKPIGDPNMKYLMRQATNLASLLAALLNTIREVQS